ncbi:DUF4166 domain-containing protein [Massilia glaciei]|nr:DUF4166 domain-containing protein [Massilia glaciei]
MTATLVSDWFGARFDDLHPLLQALHRGGGTLRGPVEVVFEPGLRGAIGRLLARRFRIPLIGGRHALVVTISHQTDGLHWERRFADGGTITSIFAPVGRLPDGHWIERTGHLTMLLTVDTDGGGWHWRPLAYRLFGLRVPVAMLPRVRAGKWIEDGNYRFSVTVGVPLLGKVLSYSGLLRIASA